MPAVTRKATIAEIEAAPNLAELVEEYAQESAIDGLPHPTVRTEMYRQLEAAGVLFSLASYVDDKLIGFCGVLSSLNPHHGVRLAVVESFFVAKEYRKTGAGIQMKRAAERHAEEIKSPGILFVSPVGGVLYDVLIQDGYVESNRVLFKKLPYVKHREIAPMSDSSIDKVRQLTTASKQYPQVDIPTEHVLHGGMYSRTILIPKGVLLTGALIKIPTMLTLSGDCVVYMDGEAIELSGYNVFSAHANRKQAFLARTETWLTMVFPTNATTVDEAEKEFTEEFEALLSRQQPNSNVLKLVSA